MSSDNTRRRDHIEFLFFSQLSTLDCILENFNADLFSFNKQIHERVSPFVSCKLIDRIEVNQGNSHHRECRSNQEIKIEYEFDDPIDEPSRRKH